MGSNDKTVFVNQQKAALDLEAALDQTYRDLGKAYYEGRFEDPLPELLPFFDRITGIKKEMEGKKGVPVCPSCGQKLKEGAAFCSKCGMKVR